MKFNKHPIDLGAPIAELKNSPIINSLSDEQEMIETEIPEERVCYFNGKSFEQGVHIKSGTIILQCDRGVWVEADMPDEF